jgi:hypothetical protein
MSATQISKAIEDTVQALEELRDAVMSHRVHLTRRMVIGITEDSKQFANATYDRSTMMNYEDIASISDSSSRSLIIYESTVMKSVEFAIHDDYSAVCLLLTTIDGVITWMTPSSGDDPAELYQLIELAKTARRLMR